jgi:hypothetical protein
MRLAVSHNIFQFQFDFTKLYENMQIFSQNEEYYYYYACDRRYSNDVQKEQLHRTHKFIQDIEIFPNRFFPLFFVYSSNFKKLNTKKK